jgi:hypothetical protein
MPTINALGVQKRKARVVREGFTENAGRKGEGLEQGKTLNHLKESQREY